MIDPKKLPLTEGKYIIYRQLKQNAKKFPTVVYLPGFGSDSTSTKALAIGEYCKKTNKDFLAFDYFGHGGSYGNFIEHCLSDWIDNSITAINELIESEEVILIGSSMGGFIALHIAMKLKHKINSLLLIAPAPDLTHRLMLASLTDEHLKKLEDEGIIAEMHSSGNEYVITKRLIDDGEKHLIMNQNTIPISIPIEIIHGIEDKDVPYQLSLELTEKLASKNVNLTLIKDAQHQLSREKDLEIILRTLEAMYKWPD